MFDHASEAQPTKYRNRVLALLSLLLVITYLDRVSISVAGPRMQEAFRLGPVAWGWVAGVFTLAYGVFEIPSGALGDRVGPRRVLTRIVLWWSAFTSLTGAVTGYYPLLAARFLFGAGEAGAFPNTSVAVSRWVPAAERARAFGIILMSAQAGGAIAPLLVVPIQARYGWRASFYVFGIVGVLWCAIWYGWFRDSPEQMRGLPPAELAEAPALAAPSHHRLPWKIVLPSPNFWAVLGVAFCYACTLYFFQSWFHTYLVKARGFAEHDLLLSSLPFVVAACANLLGGLVCQALIRRVGLKWGRRAIGAAGLGVAGLGAFAVILTPRPIATLVLLSLVYGGITFQQPIVFAVCLDIGSEYAGAVVGAMNTASQAGSLFSSLGFGYLVDRYGSYDVPFIPMAAILLAGAGLWLLVDPTQKLAARAAA